MEEYTLFRQKQCAPGACGCEFLVGVGQYDRVGPALCLELVLAIAAGPGEAAVFEVESAPGLSGRRCPPQFALLL